MTEHATASGAHASGGEHPAAPLGSRQAHREASERDKRARSFLLRLSLINWGIAVIAWSISAFLGITSPASIIVYSVLFVIGLLAVLVALLTYLLEKFAHRPPDYEHAALEDQGDETTAAVAAAVAGAAAPAVKGEAPAAAKGDAPAAPKLDGVEDKPSAPAAGPRPAAPAGEGKPAAPASGSKSAAAPQGDAAKGDGKSAADGDAPAAPKG